MTAYASVETAVEALKKGAYDYLTKPLDFDELRLTLERAMEHCFLKEENRLLKESLGDRFDRRNLIGRSAAMNRLLDTAAQVAPSEATVLVTGESGTGKEMIAGLIHFNSLRKEGPFIKFNCAAIAETLLESELFGHEKGAFTGADRRKEGKFRQADRGSLFLDEVSEMSLGMQVKLLRVLQEREITRVGGEEVIKIDVRLIAATNRDLLREIAAGRSPVPGEKSQDDPGFHTAGDGSSAPPPLAGKRPGTDECGGTGRCSLPGGLPRRGGAGPSPPGAFDRRDVRRFAE
jgi:two-component system response regulator HydG